MWAGIAILVALIAPLAVRAGYWARYDDDGVVIDVRIAEPEVALRWEDGPWFKCTGRCGKGFIFDGMTIKQNTPVIAKSSYTIEGSTPTK